jgi:hypothetical protein
MAYIEELIDEIGSANLNAAANYEKKLSNYFSLSREFNKSFEGANLDHFMAFSSSFLTSVSALSHSLCIDGENKDASFLKKIIYSLRFSIKTARQENSAYFDAILDATSAVFQKAEESFRAIDLDYSDKVRTAKITALEQFIEGIQSDYSENAGLYANKLALFKQILGIQSFRGEDDYDAVRDTPHYNFSEPLAQPLINLIGALRSCKNPRSESLAILHEIDKQREKFGYFGEVALDSAWNVFKAYEDGAKRINAAYSQKVA